VGCNVLTTFTKSGHVQIYQVFLHNAILRTDMACEAILYLANLGLMSFSFPATVKLNDQSECEVHSPINIPEKVYGQSNCQTFLLNS